LRGKGARASRRRLRTAEEETLLQVTSEERKVREVQSGG